MNSAKQLQKILSSEDLANRYLCSLLIFNVFSQLNKSDFEKETVSLMYSLRQYVCAYPVKLDLILSSFSEVPDSTTVPLSRK